MIHGNHCVSINIAITKVLVRNLKQKNCIADVKIKCLELIVAKIGITRIGIGRISLPNQYLSLTTHIELGSISPQYKVISSFKIKV